MNEGDWVPLESINVKSFDLYLIAIECLNLKIIKLSLGLQYTIDIKYDCEVWMHGF